MQKIATTPMVKRPNFAALTGRKLDRFLTLNASYVSDDDFISLAADKVAIASLVFDRKIEDFAAGLEKAAELDREAQAASDALQAFPRGPMGLTPDDVKFSEAYKKASERYNRAHAALRDFNGPFTKRFASELTEHRLAVRQAKMLKNSSQ